MTTNETYQIVAAVDLDDTAHPTWVAVLAMLANPHAHVSLLHVVRTTERDVRSEPAETFTLLAEGHRLLQELVARGLKDPSSPLAERVDVYVGLGDPATQIVALATDVEADLIVVGTHDRTGLQRLMLGSVSSEVFRTAPCSVLVARPADYSDRSKSPSIAPPLAPGQAPAVRGAPLVRHRSRPFATFNASIFPTGIPLKQVR